MPRSDIKAGSAYVELYTKNSRFQRGLNDARRELRNFGGDLKGLGQIMATASIAMLTPVALAVKQFSSFENALASLKAAANPTAGELDRIKAAAMEMSGQLKQKPTAIIQAFTELLKAGMSVESVLGGAGEAAVKFAKVGELEVAQAATVMSDAMTNFGTDATKTVDILSSAADASSISIDQVAQSFSMAAAVGKLANQDLHDLAEAIAILGNNGLKGSDAGTSIKTMLLSLMAPTETGAKAFAELGLNVRDAAGEMMPMRSIIDQLAKAVEGLAPDARDAALKDLFGTDGLRAGSILLKAGTKGWDEFGRKMDESLTVGQKYNELANTLSASLQGIWASVEKLSISIGEALAPELQKLSKWITDVSADAISWAQNNKETIVTLAKVAVAVGALGGALMALGGLAAGIATIGALLTPLGLVIAALVAIGGTATYLYAAGEAAKMLGDEMNNLRKAGDAARGSDAKMFARLQQLAEQQDRTSAELSEAADIIDALETKYGELGLSIDANTGKVNANADAYQHLANAMKESAIADLSKELKEKDANISKLKGQHWQATLGDDATWLGVDEKKAGELAQKLAKEVDDRQRLQERLDKLNGLKGPLALPEVAGGPAPSENKKAAAAASETHAQREAAAEVAEKAAEEAKERQEKMDKLEEQMARNRRTRVEQEIHEIKTLAEERRKLLDESVAGADEYLQIEMDAAAAISDIKRKAAAEETAERERNEQERRQSDREIQAQIDSAKIDLDKSLTDTQKEVAKIELEKQNAMAAAMEAGQDPDKVAESFDLRKQLAMQKGGGDSSAVAGTFSAAAASAYGQSGGNAPQDKMVKSLEEIRKLAKDQYEEQKRQRREKAVLR